MMIKKTKGSFPDFDQYDEFKRIVPVLIANEVKDHFLEGFRKGGGQTDKSRGGWAKRKQERGKRARRSNRAILVDTGALRGDIKKRKITFRSIIVGTRNILYAVYNNDGTEKMPQREFIGQSRKLDIKVIRIIKQEFNRMLK